MVRQVTRHRRSHTRHHPWHHRAAQLAWDHRHSIQKGARHAFKYAKEFASKFRVPSFKKKEKPVAAIKEAEAETHDALGNRTISLSVHKKYKTELKGSNLYYMDNYPVSVVNGNMGTQAVTELCQVGNLLQWLSTDRRTVMSGANTNTGAFNMAFDPWYEWCLAKGIIGNTMVTLSYEGPYAKIVLKHATIEIDVANFSNLAVDVDIYVCVNKGYQNNSAVNAWLASAKLDITNITDVPEDVTTAGFGGRNVGTPSIYHPGNNPHWSAGFRKVYKIKRVIPVRLAGASQERVVISVHMNQMFDLNRVLNKQQGYSQLTYNQTSWTDAKISASAQALPNMLDIFAISKSGVVKDVTSGAPSLGAPDVGFIINRKISFAPIKEAVAKTVPVSIASTAIPIGAAANARTLNAVDGAAAVPIYGL